MTVSRIMEFVAAVAVAIVAFGPAVFAADRHLLVIGAGEVTGFYYPAAGAVCRVFNKERPDGAACAVSPSSGSAANLAALKAGEVDLALVQSRAAAMAAAGAEAFKEDGPFADLRALMSLHGESVVVVARNGANIHSLADLKGKRVNLGRPGAFQRQMAEIVLDAAGISEGEFSSAVELDLDEQAPELCEGNIDAAFFTGIHPIDDVASAIEDCGATLVPIKGRDMDGFLKKHSWLSRMTVKGGTYGGVRDDVPSLGLRAILATTTRLGADEAYALLKAVHANFGAFTRLHPVLRPLTKPEASKDGVAIKMHDGAEKFYAETGGR